MRASETTNITEYLRNGETARSLFDGLSSRLRKTPRVQSIRTNAEAVETFYPSYRERILENAAGHLQGLHILPGTGGRPYFVGDPPDWHALPVNDNEYLWSLNRMGWWPTLMWAWTLSGDRRYADKAVTELGNWIEACPRPELSLEAFNGVTPWRSLEVGGRMFNTWLPLLEHLVDTDIWSIDLVTACARSAAEHAEVLSEICPEYWPEADHNHYLTEMIGLFAVSCYFPELGRSASWREQSMRELERCARNQLTVDGGQIEGCPGYHNHCVKNFCYTIILARENGYSFSQEYHDRIRRGVEYSVHASRPTGTIVPWGDSDPNHSHLPVAIYGLLTFGDEAPLSSVLETADETRVREAMFETIADIPDLYELGERMNNQKASSARLPLINRQHELKQVAIRSGWDRDAMSLFFACQSPVHHGGHAHMDPMGFDFSAYGAVLLCDPGRYTYREGEDRIEFKSPQAHNCVTVDRRPPFEYLKKFDYGPQRWGDVLDVRTDGGMKTISARQESFAPVIHYRVVAIVENRFLVIVDRFEGFRDGQSAQLYFHLNSSRVERFVRNGAHGVSFMASTMPIGLELFIFAGANVGPCVSKVLSGRISEKIDHVRESRRFELDATLDRNERNGNTDTACAEIVTFAVPLMDGQSAPSSREMSFEYGPSGWNASLYIDGIRRQLQNVARGLTIE